MKKTIPTKIKYFEQLWLGSFIIGVIITNFTYKDLILPGAEIIATITLLVIIPTMLLLILLTSRKGNNITKWILTILVFIGIPFYIPNLINLFQVNWIVGLLSLSQVLIQTIAMCFLFSKEGRAYFKKAKD